MEVCSRRAPGLFGADDLSIASVLCAVSEDTCWLLSCPHTILCIASLTPRHAAVDRRKTPASVALPISLPGAGRSCRNPCLVLGFVFGARGNCLVVYRYNLAPLKHGGVQPQGSGSAQLVVLRDRAQRIVPPRNYAPAK